MSDPIASAQPGIPPDPPAAERGEALPVGKVVVALILQAVVMVALGYGLWRWSGREGADFLRLSAAEGLGGFALGAALIAVAWILFHMFPRVADRLIRLQAATYGALGGKLPLSAIIVISIAAGVGEEALFRAGIQTYLSGLIGVPGAIALASAAFAAVHLAKPVISLMLFLVGVLFGVVYWQTGSLLTVMIGHALYDVWALRYLLDQFMRLGLVGEPLANPQDDS